MIRFIKVKFKELTDKQKIAVMQDMIDHFAKDRDYVQRKADAEWYFEVVDQSTHGNEKHSDKGIAFNRAHMEAIKDVWA